MEFHAPFKHRRACLEQSSEQEQHAARGVGRVCYLCRQQSVFGMGKKLLGIRKMVGTLYRGPKNGLHVVARNLFLLLLTCSAWPRLGPA